MKTTHLLPYAPIVLLLVLVFSFLSFSPRSPKHYEFYKEFTLKQFEKKLALVPKGSYCGDFEDPYSIYNPKDSGKCKATIAVDSFYISKYEVSNGEYLEFLRDLKSKDTSFYRRMLPDTTVWPSEPYRLYYFRHPSYNRYPVVGVTHDQAEEYCRWLTGRYKKEEKRKFKKGVIRLPTNNQWRYAAHSHKSVFTWESSKMQTDNGLWRANFMVIGQDQIKREKLTLPNDKGELKTRNYYIASSAGDEAENSKVNFGDLTTPVDSYFPNSLGIYNLAGNVSEYVREKGFTKGGGWCDAGYYLQNFVEQPYDAAHETSYSRGFRYVLELEK